MWQHVEKWVRPSRRGRKPKVTALCRTRRQALLSNGETAAILAMYDWEDDETHVPDEAVWVVVGIPERDWWWTEAVGKFARVAKH